MRPRPHAGRQGPREIAGDVTFYRRSRGAIGGPHGGMASSATGTAACVLTLIRLGKLQTGNFALCFWCFFLFFILHLFYNINININVGVWSAAILQCVEFGAVDMIGV